MRKFIYFLYDCFDSDEVSSPYDDPRLILNGGTDEILATIVDSPVGTCRYEALCGQFSKERLDMLIHIGLLSEHSGFVFLDSTVIVHEDAGYLSTCFSSYISRMADILTERKERFYHLANQIQNGFSPEVNLYHLLCGATFDGQFFDYLCEENVVTTSRIHSSGLDYLIIAYEIAPELDQLSKKLLCSYNRYSDGRRALQSFGDADGDRVDFFRFSMKKLQNNVPNNLTHIESIWDSVGTDDIRGQILDEAKRFY